MRAVHAELRPDQLEDRWLSVDEIATYLGVSRDTVYAWIATRRLAAHHVGRLWRFKRDTVDGWVPSGGADETRKSTTSARPRGKLARSGR